ncbi:MAG TPA: Uma2 family endonuclease [Planctomycetaceae bacterium]|nr:Uma2 family endonuclease [Planctomycetaceae bacterium]
MSKSKLYLTQADDGLELSREEFAEADHSERLRFERVNGRLQLMVPPGFDHHRSVKPFRNHLGAYELAHPEIVEDVFQEGWQVTDPETDRIPDIQVYLRSNPDPRPFPDRVADMIFESVSEDRRDRDRDYRDKRDEYEQIGVREYVIIDRFEHKLTVLRLKGRRYVETVLGPDDVYTSPLLPGLAVPLNGII